MQVKRVFVDKKFKNKFIKIDGQILLASMALSSYPEQAEKITAELSKSDEGESIVKPYNYPSEEKMIKEVEQFKQKIYQELNIKKTKNKEEARLYVGLIYNYLSQNSSYDQIAQHDRTLKLISTKKYIEKLTKISTDLNVQIAVQGIVKNLLEAGQFELVNKLVPFIVKVKNNTNKHIKTIYKIKKKQEFINYTNAYNTTLKSNYNTLVRKRDVCLGFTYTFAYLIKGLGLNSRAVFVSDKKNENSALHIINLIGFEAEKYNIVDVTIGSHLAKRYKPPMLVGLGMGLDEYKKIYPNKVFENYITFNEQNDECLQDFINAEYIDIENLEEFESQIELNSYSLKQYKAISSKIKERLEDKQELEL